MIIDSIDKEIEMLVSHNETFNPYKIANNIMIFVIEQDLGEFYGCYSPHKRIKVLHAKFALKRSSSATRLFSRVRLTTSAILMEKILRSLEVT